MEFKHLQRGNQKLKRNFLDFKPRTIVLDTDIVEREST
jgi:hypothetical protein